MQDLDDIHLVKEFVENNSEDAFTALVTRHLGKVYSTAFRMTGNSHQAEEITQAVFVILAQKAHKLSSGVVVSGWLHETARLTAITFIRREIRRNHCEREACMEHSLKEGGADIWPQMAPLLDAAMGRLGEKDRSAVVLRFFDNKSMREVGAAMGTNEEAAKKRVRRAVEKLRAFFGKRGIETTTEALTASILANSVQMVPAALEKSVIAVALTKGTMATASIATLVKGTLDLMMWLKTKTTILVCAIALTAGGVGVAIKTMDGALKRLEETPGGKQTLAAVKFLDSLQKKGELPGYTLNTNVSAGLMIPGLRYVDDKAGWQITQTNLEPYPITRTFDLITNAQAGSAWHYTVVRGTEKENWRIQRAWRTDHDGKITDEFPLTRP